MMPMSSHGPAPAEPIIVEIEGIGELEFPADTDPSVIQAKVSELTKPKDYSQYGPMSQLYRDMDEREQNAAWTKENAPAIGAGLATTAGAATGVGLIPSLVLAGAGGYLGARGRGDDRGTAATEGVKQGVLEGAGRGGMRVVGGIAKRIYRGAIPKAIQDKFSRADLAGEGVENRVVLGTKQGVSAAEGAGTKAAQKVQAAAPSAPTFGAADVKKAFDAKRTRAGAGRKPERVSEIDAHVQQAMKDIGNTPMDGAAQLARKEILEQEGKSAMTAANSNLAAVNPQLANIERKAIVSNLRKSPEMNSALNKSQAAVGLTRAARATENSSVINRSHGGVWNAARSPMAFSGAGIAVNEARQALNPQVLRLLDMIMRQGSHQQ